jgi:hypothetical protein
MIEHRPLEGLGGERDSLKAKSVNRWSTLPNDLRAKDLRTALALARTAPVLSPVAASYDLAEAVTLVQKLVKGCAVLLTLR